MGIAEYWNLIKPWGKLPTVSPLRPPAPESGWVRVDLYTLAYTPPGQWRWFATIRVQHDGRFVYSEPGNDGFGPVGFDDLAKAMNYAIPRWHEHRTSLEYVDNVLERQHS